MSSKFLGVVAAGAALALSLSLSASAVTAQSAAPDVAAPLPPSLMAAAAAFDHYGRTASAVDPVKFTSGPSVASALVIGSSYEPKQLLSGMIAYGALAALRDEGFVQAVREAGGERARDPNFAANLIANPYTVLQVEGADRAAGLAQSALAARGAALDTAGKAVKQSAYTVQHSQWSLAKIAEPAARLTRVKALSAQVYSPDSNDMVRVMQPDALRLRVGGPGPTPTPVVVRALALAALAVLNEVPEDPSALTILVDDPQQSSCLRMSKLNLYQCLAVAGPHYEDIFCLGQHALMDTGQCVMKAVGATPGTSIQSALP